MAITSLPKLFLLLGLILGFIGVVLGAFGAHALKQRISSDLLAIFEVGVRYQMYHALLLIALSFIYQAYPNSFIQTGGMLIFSGTLVFSGTLYLLALTGITTWGAITPIGGVLLLAGWLLSIIGVIK